MNSSPLGEMAGLIIAVMVTVAVLILTAMSLASGSGHRKWLTYALLPPLVIVALIAFAFARPDDAPSQKNILFGSLVAGGLSLTLVAVAWLVKRMTLQPQDEPMLEPPRRPVQKPPPTPVIRRAEVPVAPLDSEPDLDLESMLKRTSTPEPEPPPQLYAVEADVEEVELDFDVEPEPPLIPVTEPLEPDPPRCEELSKSDPSQNKGEEYVVPAEHHRAGTRVLVFRRAETVVRTPSIIGNRYKVQSMLTACTTGAILRAVDTHLGGRPVLIKMNRVEHREWFPGHRIVSPHIENGIREQRQRLCDEKDKLLRLSRLLDDRIPTVCNFVEDYSALLHGPHESDNWFWEQSATVDVPEILDTEPYLVLRHIEGENLRQLIDTPDAMIGGPNTLDRVRTAYSLGRELCALLAQLHSRRQGHDYMGEPSETYYVYQDLKPDHLIRTPAGNFYLIDFSSVREVSLIKENHVYNSDSAEYTQGYAAPEIFPQDRLDVNELSDIYTVGTTLFHLATSEAPQPGSAFREQLRDARTKLEPRLHEKLFDLIDRCTLSEQSQRHDAISQLREELLHREKQVDLPIDVLRHSLILRGKGV